MSVVQQGVVSYISRQPIDSFRLVAKSDSLVGKGISAELTQHTLLLQTFSVKQIHPTIQLCDYRGSASDSNKKSCLKMIFIHLSFPGTCYVRFHVSYTLLVANVPVNTS